MKNLVLMRQDISKQYFNQMLNYVQMEHKNLPLTLQNTNNTRTKPHSFSSKPNDSNDPGKYIIYYI